MKNYTLTLFTLLLFTLPLSAAPPVELPPEVKGEVGAFVTIRGKTEGKVVQFVALDPGLNVFPSDLLSDKKATVVSAAKPGRYRVLAYSSVKDDPTEPAVIVVVIGDPAPVPPNPGPTPDPTPTPVKDQKLFVVLIEETEDAVAGRGALLVDKELAARFKERGHKWRVADQNVVGVDGNPPPDLKRFLELSKGKTLPQLFLVDEKGVILKQKDGPKTAAELLSDIKKVGG